MKRAALLPTPGDPFLLNLWLKFYESFWADEVDKLYIYVNSPNSLRVFDYIKTRVKRSLNTVFIYSSNLDEHGTILSELVKRSKEDLLMFVEDDGLIFKSGKVKACFDLIETGVVDAVGSKRGSCSQWLYELASKKFGIDNSGYGDNGPNFWPNFFFAKRSDLLTVTNFAAKTWNTGEPVKYVDCLAPELTTGDTFVEGSLQLRSMGLRFAYEPQYHLMADDADDFSYIRNAFSTEACWLHIGSLSSGFNGMLRDAEGRSLARRHLDPPQEYVWANAPQGDLAKMEFERRVAWLSLALDNAEPGELVELQELYAQSLDRVVVNYQLSANRIQERKLIYSRFMP